MYDFIGQSLFLSMFSLARTVGRIIFTLLILFSSYFGLFDHIGMTASVTQFGDVLTVYAEGTPEPPKTNQLETGIISSLNTLVSLMYSLFLPLTFFAGWLLTPDWVMGDFFGMRAVLYSLWILVSNVVYVVFAIILIAIAFMNILGV